MIMNVILWLAFGALAGWAVSKMMRMQTEHSTMSNVIVGMIGAFVGGAFAEAMRDGTGFSAMSLFIAAICAVILLGLVRMFTHRGPLMHH